MLKNILNAFKLAYEGTFMYCPFCESTNTTRDSYKQYYARKDKKAIYEIYEVKCEDCGAVADKKELWKKSPEVSGIECYLQEITKPRKYQ